MAHRSVWNLVVCLVPIYVSTLCSRQMLSKKNTNRTHCDDDDPEGNPSPESVGVGAYVRSRMMLFSERCAKKQSKSSSVFIVVGLVIADLCKKVLFDVVAVARQTWEMEIKSCAVLSRSPTCSHKHTVNSYACMRRQLH